MGVSIEQGVFMPAESYRVLVISENPPWMGTFLSDIKSLGYTVSLESQLEFNIDAILRQEPAAILFDLTTWNADILQVYQRLKSNPKLENQGTSVIVLASEDSLTKLPLAIEFDDLLMVPCRTRELDFRIKRLLWQKDMVVDQEIIKIDDLVIYLARYEVRVKGEAVELTFKECELLKYLATHRGRAFNRESLLNIIWGYDYYGGTRTVDVHIRRIRAKIGDEDEACIKTVRGVGYMFKE